MTRRPGKTGRIEKTEGKDREDMKYREDSDDRVHMEDN